MQEDKVDLELANVEGYEVIDCTPMTLSDIPSCSPFGRAPKPRRDTAECAPGHRRSTLQFMHPSTVWVMAMKTSTKKGGDLCI